MRVARLRRGGGAGVGVGRAGVRGLCAARAEPGGLSAGPRPGLGELGSDGRRIRTERTTMR
jgi:hypothetical protein